MPYIHKDDRIRVLTDLEPETVGELNFLITKLCKEYLDRRGERYRTHNDILGVLTAVTHEWYRRITSVYEDRKIEENGDV